MFNDETIHQVMLVEPAIAIGISTKSSLNASSRGSHARTHPCDVAMLNRGPDRYEGWRRMTLQSSSLRISMVQTTGCATPSRRLLPTTR